MRKTTPRYTENFPLFSPSFLFNFIFFFYFYFSIFQGSQVSVAIEIPVMINGELNQDMATYSSLY